MLQLNVVHLDIRMLAFKNAYIIINLKKNGGRMYWILLQETYWYTGYFRMTRPILVCRSQVFEDAYKNLINAAEVYFLVSSNKASNNIESKNIVSKFLLYLKLQLMLLKIIHKSEGSHLRCYQKRRYTESIGRSFNTLYFCPKFLNMRDKR